MKKLFSTQFFVLSFLYLFSFTLANANEIPKFNKKVQRMPLVQETTDNGILGAVNTDSKVFNQTQQTDNDRALVYVLPTMGSTSGNGRAPQGSRLFNNGKYLITGPEMTASGFANGTVTSVGWQWNLPRPTGAGAPVAQSIPTTGNLRIYLKDTVAGATVLGSTLIDTNGVGYTKVFDGTISYTATDTSLQNIDVTCGGPGTSPFTATPGNGILVIYVYKTTTTIATPLGAPTVSCNTSVAGVCNLTYQSQTANGNIGISNNQFRPVTRFGAATIPVDVASVGPVYSYGKAGICPCPPYTNLLMVNLEHKRVAVDTFFITTTVKNVAGGGVKEQFLDTLITDTTERIIIFYAYDKDGDVKKFDSIITTVKTSNSEEVVVNNRAVAIKQSTLNKWNQAEPGTAIAGGVGFTGGTGAFVSSFYTGCSIPITQVNLVFNAANLAVSQPYTIRIYADDTVNFVPGTLLYESPVQNTPVGTGLPIKVNYKIPAPVSVPAGYYYVGINQSTTTNIAYGFQNESPIRPFAFYYNADAAPGWTDFSDAGIPFKLDIEAVTTLDLSLGMWLQGYYVPPNPAVNTDTVTLIAHTFAPPYTAIESSIGIAGTNGLANFKFNYLENDIDYYFEIRNRNHLETWTANTGVKIDECGKIYDMTQSASSAFGSNMYLQLPEPSRGTSVFTIYGGDVDQDGFINGIDVGAVFNASSAFVSGRSVYDINGDEIVDLTDLTITFNNNTAFVSAMRP